MKTKLWTKNFTIIVLGSIISAVGGVGLSLAMSVVIYDQTSSTFLSGLYVSLMLIPQFLIPILSGPIIDRVSRKNLIVYMDVSAGLISIIVTLITWNGYFSYILYVEFGVMFGSLGAVYSLAYNSLFPNLIPKGAEQKGYSIGSLIYPLVNMAILPLATLIFANYGVALLFLLNGILTLTAAVFETKIDIEETHTNNNEKYSVKQHFISLNEGYKYLWDQKAILYIFIFFFFMMMGEGINVLVYPFFENHSDYSVVEYSLLISLQSAGYMFGGIIHYFIKIPTKIKYRLSIGIYFMFCIFGVMFFYVPFAAMILIRLFLGIMGMNSANIRITAVNGAVKDKMRGRVNSVFGVMVSISMFIGNLLCGYMGEFMRIEHISIAFNVMIAAAVVIVLMKNKKIVKPLYNMEI